MSVEASDRRPTGAPRLQKAPARWQRRLNRRLAGDHTPALKEWRQLLLDVAPQVATDEFTPLLAERLAALSDRVDRTNDRVHDGSVRIDHAEEADAALLIPR